MFSPSLVSMMLHSIWSDGNQPQEQAEFSKPDEVARALRDLKSQRSYREWPRVPVVGRARSMQDVQKRFHPHVSIPELSGISGVFFWGRIPVNLLIDDFWTHCYESSDQEYVDLGTTLNNYTSSGSVFESTCQTLLAKTATSTITVRVAQIDRGEEDVGNQADDFGGKLQHADRIDLKISDHALKVLSVLLERLDQHRILPETEVLCALVRPPANAIGRKCFEHANATELLDALQKLHPMLTGSSLPVSMNLSMGFHVGPHNGESPLEDFIHQCASATAGRFLFAAAGNDGMTGVAGQRLLSAGVAEYLKLRSSHTKPGEILVEFWWQEPLRGAKVSIKAEVKDDKGNPLMTGPLQIDSTRAGATLATIPPGFGNVVCQSLFHAKCHNAMSCIALALSTQNPPGLPVIDLEFSLESNRDLPMSAWLTVRDGEQLSAFIEGTQDGSICVPAADPNVIGVAGVETATQSWSRSSRGPSGVYQIGATTPTVSYLAHSAQLGHLGEYGTSFASPRACADAADVLRDPNTRKNKCGTVRGLVDELFSSRGRAPSRWNARTGLGVII